MSFTFRLALKGCLSELINRLVKCCHSDTDTDTDDGVPEADKETGSNLCLCFSE